ncbi:MAG: amidohydrolase family protein [Vulcanimicrobiota bacterium]
MMKKWIFLVLLLSGLAVAQPQRYVLTNGVIHTATREAFHGYVVVTGDRIEEVGEGAPPEGEVVDLGGLHLYPALIDADSALGLVEVESLRATRDHQEVGELNPNLEARYAYRAESDTVAVARSQGVLYSGVNPSGPAIAGQGSVMRTWGWNWEDMTVFPSWALAVDWPNVEVSLKAEKKSEALESIGKSLFFLDEAFAQARSYREAGLRDLKWGSLKPYAEGHRPVLIRVDGESQIRTALDWSEENGLRPVLVTGRDIQNFAGELATRNIPVIYGSLFNQNPREAEPYDLHYRVPQVLGQAGVTVALSAMGPAFDVREIRDLAGRARAFGLDSVQALQTITLNPARILGVDEQLGSIEKGKKASFVLCTGDLLEVAPVVTRAWGEGREIELEDRQKELYRRYRDRLLKP